MLTSLSHKYPGEWNSYMHMMQRCYNPENDRYSSYGGRGIEVCQSWRDSFETFLFDMGTRPERTTLDRKDNDKNYCADNCRWATSSEQQLNKGTPRNNTSGFKGVDYSPRRRQWRARIFGFHIGWFKTQEAAIIARQSWEAKK